MYPLAFLMIIGNRYRGLYSLRLVLRYYTKEIWLIRSWAAGLWITSYVSIFLRQLHIWKSCRLEGELHIVGTFHATWMGSRCTPFQLVSYRAFSQPSGAFLQRSDRYRHQRPCSPTHPMMPSVVENGCNGAWFRQGCSFWGWIVALQSVLLPNHPQQQRQYLNVMPCCKLSRPFPATRLYWNVFKTWWTLLLKILALIQASHPCHYPIELMDVGN